MAPMPFVPVPMTVKFSCPSVRSAPPPADDATKLGGIKVQAHGERTSADRRAEPDQFPTIL